jgi:hypothetical protein
MYPTVPFQVFEVAEDIYRGRNPFFARLTSVQYPGSLPPAYQASNSTTEPRFSLDLAEAVVRQWEFSKKITNLYPQDPVGTELFTYAKLRYVKFMNLMRVQNRMIVPTLDIDLFWHTHQLSSLNYDSWCRKHIGRPINHDDTIEGDLLSNGLEGTKEAWAREYNEAYLGPGPKPSKPQPQENTKFIHPPPMLSPAQKALWIFDVEKQKRHEEYEYAMLQISERQFLGDVSYALAEAEKELTAARKAFEMAYKENLRARAAAMGRPNMHPDLPIGWESQKGWRRFIAINTVYGPIIEQQRNAIAEATKPQVAKVNAIKARIHELKGPIYDLESQYNAERRLWREERWKILVNTGGIGTPERREPLILGFTTKIPAIHPIFFPLYAANWYSLEPLGAYNYSAMLSDGYKLGKSAGGWLCGALLNGGKKPEPVQSSCGACGGG